MIFHKIKYENKNRVFNMKSFKCKIFPENVKIIFKFSFLNLYFFAILKYSCTIILFDYIYSCQISYFLAISSSSRKNIYIFILRFDQFDEVGKNRLL